MTRPTNSIPLPHAIITRAPGLLPMMYTTRELAEELKVSFQDIKRLVDGGAPHERDSRQHLWIDGTAFAQWVEETRFSQKNRNRLAHDEALCFRCRKPVKLSKPHATINKKQKLLTGICPECGATINRGARHGQS